jgi:hypothetical protein
MLSCRRRYEQYPAAASLKNSANSRTTPCASVIPPARSAASNSSCTDCTGTGSTVNESHASDRSFRFITQRAIGATAACRSASCGSSRSSAVYLPDFGRDLSAASSRSRSQSFVFVIKSSASVVRRPKSAFTPWPIAAHTPSGQASVSGSRGTRAIQLAVVRVDCRRSNVRRGAGFIPAPHTGASAPPKVVMAAGGGRTFGG